jgi:M6 family metalloprotease-like protein
MRKFYTFAIIVILLLLHSLQCTAVSAYPFPFMYTQPDGTQVTITLKGDERAHWGETTDGYKLLNNGKDGWEYAVLNVDGDLQCSGRLAREVSKRSLRDKALLGKTSKNIRFSQKQVNILKSIWETQHSIDNTSNSSVQNSIGTSSISSFQKSSSIDKVFSPVGNRKLVMILIGFTDKAFTKTKADFEALMNQVGYNLNGAAGSVKDYFLETSYNQFNVSTTVAGPYTATRDMAYYGANSTSTGGSDKNPKELIKEAITQADNDVNFADFDNDGDGTVDGVYVVYAGYGEASGASVNTIWPHASSISPTMICDGVKISKYSCSNEMQGTSGSSITTIGVICHEFGHVCGAMDYYDTNYATNGQYDGMGYWDLMSSGNWNGSPSGSRPAHMNAYDKIRLHWVTPTLLTSDASITLKDIKAYPTIYRYNTTTPNEYFLLENRQQTGFNASVPGHGLMIYHVDGDYITNHSASNDINTGSHQGMLPMSATSTTSNGVTLSTAIKINSSACPWPGTSHKTTFDDTTTPNSKSWNLENTNGGLYNITENTGVISLCFKSCPTVNPVFNFAATPASSSQVNLSWTNNAANNDVIIAYNTSNTFGTLTDGTTYNVADVLAGGGTILFKGPASSFNQAGLSTSTTYYYQIWAVNGSTSYSAGTVANAQTLCNSVSTLPFYEGFEGGVIPGCWTNENITGTNNWAYQKGGYSGNIFPSTAHNGLKNATLFNASYTPVTTKLISPPLDLMGSTSPVLKFWHTQPVWAGQDILRVYYRTSATDTWTQLAVYTSSILNWTMESINLPNPSSTYYIAFEATSNYGFGVSIDDIEVRATDCVGGTWLGTFSSDWFDLRNWCGSVPASTSNVIIPSGTPFSPTINASGAICQNIAIDNGASLTMNASTQYTVDVTGDWINNGTFNAGAGKVKFSGTNNLQIIGGSSTTNFNVLSVSKGAQNRILEITSPVSLSATSNPLELASGTFKLSSNSVITPFTSNPTIGTTGGIWNNGGTINSTGLTWQLSGLLRNSAGTINIGNATDNSLNYLTGSSITIEEGTLNIASRICPKTIGTDITTYTQSGGTVNVNTAGSTSTSVAPFDITSGSYFTMTGGTNTIQNASGFTSEYQNLATTNSVTGGTLQIGGTSTSGSPVIRINSSAPVYNLTVNAAGTPTVRLLSNFTILKDITLGVNSQLDANSLNLKVGGDWINNGGALVTPLSGTVTFNGNVSQNILGSAATTFNNVTLNNGNGLNLGGSVNATVNGVLNFTSGVITTGNNTIIIPASGSISRTSGHVFGNLQKTIATGTNVSTTFEIGDNTLTNYAPLTVTMASVTTAGNLLAKTTAGDYSTIASSKLFPSVSINRNWTLTNYGVGFTTYTAGFTYLPGDLDATVNASNLQIGEYASSTWTYPTIGTNTLNNIQALGLNSFGSFQLAEGCTQLVTPTFDAVATICAESTLSALPTTSNNGIVGAWSPALDNTKTTVYTFTPAVGQCATTATLTITVNPVVTPTFDAVAPICDGSTLSTLPTTSNNGITGTWSPALDNTKTTVYTFTPATGQCATTATLSITVNPVVTPTFNAVAAICAGSTLSALPTTSNNGITGTWSPALDNTKTTVYTFTPATGQCATTATLSITVNPVVTPTFNAVAPICDGSTLSTLPTTSNNGITGTWSPALDNTKTTVYTFTPAVGQCATTATLTITVNPVVTPTFDAVAPICDGSTLSTLPTTSNNGITGTWSPALDNTKTTVYTFTPAVGQCATTATLSITVNPVVTPTFNAVAPICDESTLSALPTTSNNGITGTWSPALDNTKTTVYTFTPATGQCAAPTTLTITVNPVVTPAFDAVAAICAGSMLSALPTTSNNGITGTWSPALDNTKTTVYTFTPATGQCAATMTLTITVNDKPTKPTVSVSGFVLSSSSPTGNQWYNQNGEIKGATDQNYTTTSNGVYYTIVTLTGCSSDASNSINITSTAIQNVNDDKIIKVYPNPVSNELKIETEEVNEPLNIEIVNGFGQVIYRGNFVGKATIQTDRFASGVYFVRIENGKKIVFKKVIKN